MLGTVVGGLLVHAARASVAEPEPGPETGSAGASEQEPAPSDDGNTLPSLDELLGLEEDAGDAPSDAATADEQRARELDRELSAQEAANALVEAVRPLEAGFGFRSFFFNARPALVAADGTELLLNYYSTPLASRMTKRWDELSGTEE